MLGLGDPELARPRLLKMFATVQKKSDVVFGREQMCVDVSC